MRVFMNRRRWLGWMAALVALPLAPLRRARAQTEVQTAALEAMVRKLTGGAPLQRGRVQLDIPTLADNGNSVSLKVAVDGTAGRVRSIHLFAPRNPRPNLANFYFGAGAGRAQVSTRIRLSGSQSVLAIAALEDGSFWSASADVAVTVSACWDAS